MLSLVALHPGHGTTEPSAWAHYLTEPLHLVVLLAVAVISVAGAAWLLRRDRTRD